MSTASSELDEREQTSFHSASSLANWRQARHTAPARARSFALSSFFTIAASSPSWSSMRCQAARALAGIGDSNGGLSPSEPPSSLSELLAPGPGGAVAPGFA